MPSSRKKDATGLTAQDGMPSDIRLHLYLIAIYAALSGATVCFAPQVFTAVLTPLMKTIVPHATALEPDGTWSWIVGGLGLAIGTLYLQAGTLLSLFLCFFLSFFVRFFGISCCWLL